MYGLEKKSDERFAFDLEKDIKTKPQNGKKILEKTEKKIAEIKKHLREGASEKDFDSLGTLLHGYAALQTVVRKLIK